MMTFVSLSIQQRPMAMLLFSKQLTHGGLGARTYYGYSANGLTVRVIQTRDPSVTFADNAAVLAASRLTGGNPAHVVSDAIRDVRGDIAQMIDASGITTTTVRNALRKPTSVTRNKGSLTLGT
jgi:YD repeat-containing protein